MDRIRQSCRLRVRQMLPVLHFVQVTECRILDYLLTEDTGYT
jgi:hypothetical protein